MPYTDIRAVIVSPLAAAEITKDLLQNVLTQLGHTDPLMAVKKVSRWIPIGIPAATGLSLTITYRVLNFILKQLTDDAQFVFEKTLGL